MRRTAQAWAAVAVLVVLALGGCGRVTTDIAVHDDGSYDMTLVMSGSEAELEAAGLTPEAFISVLIEQLTSQPGMEALDVTEYRQDGYAGVVVAGQNIPGDDAGIFRRKVITTDDDGIHFTLKYPLTSVTSSFTPEQTAAVEITTTVSFPTAVTEHNGTLVDDDTVQWTGNGSTDLDYTASSAPPGGAARPTPDATSAADAADAGSGWVLPLALALGVLVIAGLGAWLILRNRSDGGQGGPGGLGSGAPDAYAPSQGWDQPGQGAPQPGQQRQHGAPPPPPPPPPPEQPGQPGTPTSGPPP